METREKCKEIVCINASTESQILLRGESRVQICLLSDRAMICLEGKFGSVPLLSPHDSQSWHEVSSQESDCYSRSFVNESHSN